MSNEFQPSPSQAAIIELTEGRHVVLAPPGSGKTEILVQRLKKAMRDGVHPEDMICLTFTNRAARVMQERVGCVPPSLHIGNFHSFAVKFLKEIDVFRSQYSVLDEEDSEELLTLALDQLMPIAVPGEERDGEKALIYIENSITDSLLSSFGMRRTGGPAESRPINWCVGSDLRTRLKKLIRPYIRFRYFRENSAVPGIVSQEAYNVILEEIGLANVDLAKPRPMIYGAAFVLGALKLLDERYSAYKDATRAYDFDDLLQETLNWLCLHPESRQFSQYDWVEVDEAQDLNDVQWEILRRITRPDSCVVIFADPMQAIFSFMGAHPETMQRNLAAFSLVPLDVNFRSPKYLLDLYRDYAAQNLKQEVNWIPNKAETAGRDGLVYWVLEDDEHEGIFLARELIPSMLNKQSGRISILTKSNAKAIDYSESLYHQGIDHFIVTQVDLFRTRAAKDFMAFLQTLSRPHGRLSWVRLLSAATGIPLGASFEIVNDCFKSGILPHWLLKGCGADLYYPPIEMTHIAMNHRLVVLDTETTGLDLATSDIIQFAAVEIIQGRIGKSINIFLKTCQDVGASEAVHHITKSRLDADGVERREAFRMILEFIQDSPIAAHNMDFDMAMLDSNIARSLGVSFRGERVAYCSLEVSIALDPDLPKHKLGCLIERYQLEGQNTHDALDDVRATAELILHYVAMARDKYVDAERFHTRHRRYCDKLREVFGGVWSIVRDDTQKSVSFQDLFEIFKGLNCSRPYESKHFADIERKLIRHMNEYTKPTYLRLLLEQELERYMLFREPDLILETDRVVVSTIHRAKGLEFEMVIIPDCHSNNYPSYFAKTPQKNDEEARLLFVAITRAIRSLVVLQPKVYTTMKGNRMSVKASPFLGKLLGYFDYNDRTGTQQQVVTRVKHICGNCGRTWSWDGSRERDNRCFGCGFVLM